jgi:lysine biosynthesis protein LysW
MLVLCPECEAEIDTQGLTRGELIPCPDCGVELELTKENPPVFEVVQAAAEDSGE